MYFLYLYAAAASGSESDTDVEENTRPRIEKKNSEGSFRGRLFSQSLKSSLGSYIAGFETSLRSPVHCDDFCQLAKSIMTKVIQIKDPEFTDNEWDVLYDCALLKEGPLSKVFGINKLGQDTQLLYIVKFLKRNALSPSRRTQLKHTYAQHPLTLRAMVADREDIFSNFSLLKNIGDIFKHQSYFAIVLPKEYFTISGEEDEVFVEISDAAQGISILELIKSRKHYPTIDIVFWLRSLGETLAMFHKHTQFVHGDFNVGNVFLKIEPVNYDSDDVLYDREQSRDVRFSLIDTHTLLHVGEDEEKAQQLFMEDVHQFITFIERMTIEQGISLDRELAREYINAFLKGYYSMLAPEERKKMAAHFSHNSMSLEISFAE